MPPAKEPQEFFFDIRSGSCSNQQHRDLLVVRRQNDRAIEAVAIEKPTGEQQGGSLIAFAKGLRTGDSECQHRRRINRIRQGVNRVEGDLQSIKIVRLFEPFIVIANSLFDR